MNPTGLPELSKPLRDLNFDQKYEKNKTSFSHISGSYLGCWGIETAPGDPLDSFPPLLVPRNPQGSELCPFL